MKTTRVPAAAAEPVVGKCLLCRKKRRLCRSHWIPRSLWAAQKQRWSHGRLRTQPEVNKPVQDGPTCHLLCAECEQRIGAQEKYAVNEFWRPLLDADPTTWTGKRYEGPEVRLFAISLAWRYLFFAEEGDEIRKRLRSAERAWGRILSGQGPQSKPTYGDHYAFAQPWLLDDKVSDFPRLNEWWRGDVGAWPFALADPSRKFIAVHLPGVICLSPAYLNRSDRDSLAAARLKPEGGHVPPLDAAPGWFKAVVNEAVHRKIEEAIPLSRRQARKDRERLEKRLDGGELPDWVVAWDFDQRRSRLRRAST